MKITFPTLPLILLCVLLLCIQAGAAVTKEPEQCTSRPCVYTIRCASQTCTGEEVAQVQTSIDDAQPGDTIRLEAGKTFAVTGIYGLMLKRKTQGWGESITITTTEAAQLPEPGTRITPAYAPLLPTIMAAQAPFAAMTTENGPSPAENYRLIGLRFTNNPAQHHSRGLLVIGTATGYKGVFTADPDSDRLLMDRANRFEAGAYVELYSTGTLPGGLTIGARYFIRNVSADGLRLSETPGGAVINILDSGTGQHTIVEQGVTRPEHQAGRIVVDRCIFTGPYDRNVRRAISLNGRDIFVLNSYIDRFQDNSTDSQGIVGYNGSGPYTIENNFVEGASENIMFGGAIGQSPDNPPYDMRGLTVSDVVLRFNYLPKNPDRLKYENWAPGMFVDQGKVIRRPNSASTNFIAAEAGVTGEVEPDWSAGTVQDGEVQWRPFNGHWLVKNNFEIKQGDRILFSHNVLDRMWADAQQTPINIKAESQPAKCRPEDPTCYYARTENITIRSNIIRSAPAAWKGSTNGGIVRNWRIENNLFFDIDNRAYGSGTEPTILISSYVSGLVIDHNTFHNPVSAAALIIEGPSVDDMPLVFRNNIVGRGKSGIKGSGRTEGNSTIVRFMCKSNACEEGQFTRNIILGIDRRSYPDSTFNLCESSSGCEPDFNLVGFNDPGQGDFGLRDDSQFKRMATDETDIGADMSQLPRIRNLRVEASARQAMFSYGVTEPIRGIPCVLQVGQKRNLSDSIDDLNPRYFTRADTDRRFNDADALERAFVVGGAGSAQANDGEIRSRDLTPGATYYYRLMCGGDARTGSFSTAAE
jgi:hypothetical protein